MLTVTVTLTGTQKDGTIYAKVSYVREGAMVFSQGFVKPIAMPKIGDELTCDERDISPA